MPVDHAYDVALVANTINDESRYGCHNRKPYAKHYWAPQRIFHSDGSFDVISVRVPSVMSRDCRSFYLWDTDTMCAGCTVKRDVEYAERMKGMK